MDYSLYVYEQINKKSYINFKFLANAKGVNKVLETLKSKNKAFLKHPVLVKKKKKSTDYHLANKKIFYP